MKIKKEIINKIRETQKEKDDIYNKYKTVDNLLNKEEFKRLRKALKEENDIKIRDWAYCLGLQLDNNIAKQYKEYYEKKLKEDRLWTIECIEIILIYTLHFNEKCKFGGNRIQDFLEDFRVSFELISKQEYKLDDYIEQLKKDRIEVHYTKGGK